MDAVRCPAASYTVVVVSSAGSVLVTMRPARSYPYSVSRPIGSIDAVLWPAASYTVVVVSSAGLVEVTIRPAKSYP
jgi:hypothetical protein